MQVEVLITFSIVLMTVSIILPVTIFIKGERQIQADRLAVANKLQDHLQHYIYESKQSLPYSFTQLINDKQVKFDLRLEQTLVKGCATWENAKYKQENFCLYAIQK